jgi:hypothetical protein
MARTAVEETQEMQSLAAEPSREFTVAISVKRYPDLPAQQSSS